MFTTSLFEVFNQENKPTFEPYFMYDLGYIRSDDLRTEIAQVQGNHALVRCTLLILKLNPNVIIEIIQILKNQFFLKKSYTFVNIY